MENLTEDQRKQLFECVDKKQLFECSKKCVVNNIFINFFKMTSEKTNIKKKVYASNVKNFITIYRHFDDVNKNMDNDIQSKLTDIYNKALEIFPDINTSHTLISAGKSKRRRNKKRSCTKRHTKK